MSSWFWLFSSAIDARFIADRMRRLYSELLAHIHARSPNICHPRDVADLRFNA